MTSIDVSGFRENLLSWYRRCKRDLPWRRTSDPYRIWISEVMLQQTRVAAALPYYERFLGRFPSVEAVASASEQDLLAAWAGLGYYHRARNIQKAAKQIAALKEFPGDYESIRSLPGVGDYTAAAVGSIAFGLPYAAVDGNAIRVLSRVSAEAGEVNSPAVRSKLNLLADKLLDGVSPGDFNQAMMELGATICLPARPLCERCPVAAQCDARKLGRQLDFPVKRGKAANLRVEHRLLLIEKKGNLLLWQRPPESRRMAGFWELPLAEQLPEARVVRALGQFRHTIVNTNYFFEVVEASIKKTKPGFQWVPKQNLNNNITLSTTANKALACLLE